MGNSASLPQSGKSFESQSSHMKSIFEGQQPESYLKLKHRKFSKSDSNINSPALSRRRRAYSAGSEEDPWGWFEDFESPNLPGNELSSEFSKQPLQKALTLPPPVSEPPVYILESSLHTQQLWYSTAGQRPRQPASEREYFEKVWMKNFEESKVQENLENLDSLLQKPKFERGSPTSNREVLYRGKGPFSNSVSKSFADHRIACMTLQLPRFRVSKGEKGEYFAEFLVVVSIGHHGAATFGVWRRHCDFKNLVAEILVANSKPETLNEFKNTLLSWQCLLHRKRWFRCLDKDYLSLKCFLLERFMHDLLFESQTPDMISDFLGLF